MIIPDKKKAVGLIVSKFDGKGGMEDMSPEQSEREEVMKVISEEIIQAVKNGDVESLKDALLAFHQNLGLD